MNKQNYETSVSEVVEIIETAQDSTPILVDLDETVFLRNSTEEYLDTLYPRVFGWFLLKLLNFVKPWNWLPGEIKGEVSRDWMRVFIATLLFPWTLILWQWRAKKLAQAYGNTTLIQALTKNENSRVTLVTQGFGFIVRPLVKHLPMTFNDVIACRFWQGAIDRQRGKCPLVTALLGEDELGRAIAVTDSTNDNPLLASVAIPCLVIWSEAKYVPAMADMADIYIPFLYLERAKRPDQQFFVNVILYDDLLILILAASWLNSQPILHAISMLFLTLSFWCIYELGYVENDIIAERFEKKPKLSQTYQHYINRINVWHAWLSAVLFAVPGLILLELTKVVLTHTSFASEVNALDLGTALIHMAFWIGLLLVVRVSFFVYNHVDKQTRIWLYFILQAYKCFGFLVLTKINVIGAMVFVAHVISRWIPYFVHRFAKSNWREEFPSQLLRIVLFGFLVIALTLGTQNTSVLLNWQTLVIFIWCVYRGRPQFMKVLRQAHSISNDQWNTTEVTTFPP